VADHESVSGNSSLVWGFSNCSAAFRLLDFASPVPLPGFLAWIYLLLYFVPDHHLYFRRPGEYDVDRIEVGPEKTNRLRRKFGFVFPSLPPVGFCVLCVCVGSNDDERHIHIDSHLVLRPVRSSVRLRSKSVFYYLFDRSVCCVRIPNLISISMRRGLSNPLWKRE
jgi:hypothetical protein